MESTTQHVVKKYLTEEEAAAVLQLHRLTLKKERLKGLIDYHKIAGGQVRYTPQQIDDYVQSHPQNAKRVKRLAT